MSNIIQKIIDNKHKIVGIEIDGNFYNVDYVSVNDVILHCYTTNTDTNVTENYYFEVKDIQNAKKIKLYKLEEI